MGTTGNTSIALKVIKILRRCICLIIILLAILILFCLCYYGSSYQDVYYCYYVIVILLLARSPEYPQRIRGLSHNIGVTQASTDMTHPSTTPTTLPLLTLTSLLQTGQETTQYDFSCTCL